MLYFWRSYFFYALFLILLVIIFIVALSNIIYKKNWKKFQYLAQERQFFMDKLFDLVTIIFTLFEVFCYWWWMMMNCFCGMVERRKVFSLISSQDDCQRSSPLQISDMLRAGFAPAQNLWVQALINEVV